MKFAVPSVNAILNIKGCLKVAMKEKNPHRGLNSKETNRNVQICQ